MITLYKNITTNQKAFNAVCRHLAKQGHRAVRHDGMCVYYNEDNGDRCAVGALFPIEAARELERDHGGAGVTEWCDDPDIALGDVDPYLLGALQACHDGGVVTGRDLFGLKEGLYEAADRWGLDPSAVDLITTWNND